MEFLQYSWITCAIVSLFSWDTLCAKSCPSVKIPNGRARVKTKGRVIEFKCNRNFQLVGVSFAVCNPSFQWSQQIPSCVGTSCERPAVENNLAVESQYNGGVLKFTCGPGLSRMGPETIRCDGKQWSSPPPRCIAENENATQIDISVSAENETKTTLLSIEPVTIDCDFETDTFCGWSQDDTDDFDWTRIKGETPTANTGPRFDHTTNSSEGHYLFLESSAPQKTGQKTRLVSPPYVYSNTGTVCLELFYHMFGPDGIGEVGNLDVFIQSHGANPRDLTAANNVFHRSGNQGDQWIRAEVEIPQQRGAFSIIVQGTRLKSWTGDIAIDDVRVYHCAKKSITSIKPVNVHATTQSGAFNSQPTNESSSPKKTTSRPSTTMAAIKKTKQPTPPPLRPSITPTPTANAASKATGFSAKPLKPLLATTTVSSARKSTLSYNTVNRRTVTTSTFTLDTHKQSLSQASVTNQTDISGPSTVSSNITSDDHSEHDNGMYTTSTHYLGYDSNKLNSDSSSSENKSLGKNESKTHYIDYMDATTGLSDEDPDIDGIMDVTGIRDTSSSPGSIALIPLIVGVVASVVVGIIVTVIMACIWVRSKRTKQEKHEEDQMNIMSDYIETNLCT